MSYDVYFDVDTGAGNLVTVADRNYTSNVSGMWDKALALPEKPSFHDDGTPRMTRRLNRETGQWHDEQTTDWGVRLLDGAPASEAASVLAAAVERMAAAPAEYTLMEPGNGWGDYPGALGFLRWMAETAAAHPDTTIRVSS